MTSTLPDGYRAVVFGANGGIGSAFVDRLRADPRCASVDALSRTSDPPIELDVPATIGRAAQTLAARAPFHLVVNAVGVLHNARLRPEKRLADIDADRLAESFRVNAIGPALLLRHFAPLLATDRSLFVLLSAKVGSIADNRLGGWIGYRASKAALNMIVKTASIEVARNRPNAIVVAMHPGTVSTALSQPFAGDSRGRAPEVAVDDLLTTLATLMPADTGTFVAYDGERLPW